MSCPHCTSTDVERLAGGWWLCQCCAKTWLPPQAVAEYLVDAVAVWVPDDALA